MLNNILNLDGVSVLDKKQQKSINGGLVTQECTFTFINSAGRWQTETSGGYSDGQAGSDEANQACVNMIAMGDASECHYNCAWDD